MGRPIDTNSFKNSVIRGKLKNLLNLKNQYRRQISPFLSQNASPSIKHRGNECYQVDEIGRYLSLAIQPMRAL